MEQDNQVPTDIDRRKLIARLLNIPPMLFGLATLEEVVIQPHPVKAGAILTSGRTALPKVVADTTKYQANIRTFLTLHYTSQAQNSLGQINTDIHDLESLEPQTRGDLQYHVREILCSYYLLASKVVADQRDYSSSYGYANHAVRVAKATKDSDLIATALYTRGRTYLYWGNAGTLERGVFRVQPEKINRAIRDFEDAKKAAAGTEKSIHPQLVGIIDVHLSRAYILSNLSREQEAPAVSFTLLDEAEEKVGKEGIDDPYQRHLVTGSLIGFVQGEYHNNKAISLTLAGRPGGALKEIRALETLRSGTLGKHLTRSQIWLDIVAADAYMGLEQFSEATRLAKRAAMASQDIHSVANIVRVVDIHGRLLQSPYKDKSDVRELGNMLREITTY